MFYMHRTPTSRAWEVRESNPVLFRSKKMITENYRPATDSKGLEPYATTAPTAFQAVPARLSGLLSIMTLPGVAPGPREWKSLVLLLDYRAKLNIANCPIWIWTKNNGFRDRCVTITPSGIMLLAVKVSRPRPWDQNPMYCFYTNGHQKARPGNCTLLSSFADSRLTNMARRADTTKL